MERNIKYISCPENEDKEKVKSEINAAVRSDPSPERFTGLRHDIRWFDTVPVQDNEALAKQRIYELDTRDYDNLAVRYYSDKSNTKRLEELKEKAEKASEKYHKALSEFYFRDSGYNFVTCKKCGSKISLKELEKKTNPNICPVCGKDLRPDSALKYIQEKKAAWKKCEAKVKEEEKRLIKKDKCTIMWLIKYEY